MTILKLKFNLFLLNTYTHVIIVAFLIVLRLLMFYFAKDINFIQLTACAEGFDLELQYRVAGGLLIANGSSVEDVASCFPKSFTHDQLQRISENRTQPKSKDQIKMDLTNSAKIKEANEEKKLKASLSKQESTTQEETNENKT